MKKIKQLNKRELSEKNLLLQAVKRSAQIEGLSLKSAQQNLKVITELQKYGRAFSI